ncbi:hypothetical protein G7046_g4795 [Stylonectria norvegica]|nr:hypothetical protein G7046_g4795 [Stylonectria norvegica]
MNGGRRGAVHLSKPFILSQYGCISRASPPSPKALLHDLSNAIRSIASPSTPPFTEPQCYSNSKNELQFPRRRRHPDSARPFWRRRRRGKLLLGCHASTQPKDGYGYSAVAHSAHSNNKTTPAARKTSRESPTGSCIHPGNPGPHLHDTVALFDRLREAACNFCIFQLLLWGARDGPRRQKRQPKIHSARVSQPRQMGMLGCSFTSFTGGGGKPIRAARCFFSIPRGSDNLTDVTGVTPSFTLTYTEGFMFLASCDATNQRVHGFPNVSTKARGAAIMPSQGQRDQLSRGYPSPLLAFSAGQGADPHPKTPDGGGRADTLAARRYFTLLGKTPRRADAKTSRRQDEQTPRRADAEVGARRIRARHGMALSSTMSWHAAATTISTSPTTRGTFM